MVPLMTVVPHPSQVNRWWNHEENRMVMRNQNRVIDKTFLSIDTAEERGLIHRDFWHTL
jgi:hypothetical protein